MRTIRLRLLLVSVLALVAAGLVVPASASAAPYCGITWGSLAKVGSPVLDPAPGVDVAGLRAGRHDCYDRLVIDLRGSRSFDRYDVRYVQQFTSQFSGLPVAVRGGAVLAITVRADVLSDSTGRPLFVPADPSEAVPVAGFRTFRQVVWDASFEGVTTIALGVRARLPFRVFTLAGIPGHADGTRVVIDVAHRW